LHDLITAFYFDVDIKNSEYDLIIKIDKKTKLANISSFLQGNIIDNSSFIGIK